MLRSTVLLVVAFAILLPLSGCKKLRDPQNGNAEATDTESSAGAGPSGSTDDADVAASDAEPSGTPRTGDVEGKRAPPPLPSMDKIRIAGRFAMKMPTNWPRKRPELPPLASRAETEAARARLTGPQQSTQQKNVDATKGEPKKTKKVRKKRSRKNRRQRARRSGRRSRRANATQKEAVPSAGLVSASMQLGGRTWMTCLLYTSPSPRD